jgi:flagellar basal-body rod protein FlgB
MNLENLTNRGATPALVNTLVFAEARHRMLANNIANWQTPGYKTRQLDAGAFGKALRQALDEKGGDPNKPFVIKGTRQFRTGPQGRLRVTPTTDPANNLLLHDGTNASIERMMSDLAQNAMMHQAATTILKGYYDGLRKAIRGRV